MTLLNNNIFHFAVVWVIASSNREHLVFATDQSSLSSFVVVRQNQFPTSGVTVVRTVTSKSAISCGDLCLRTTGSTCNGFLFGQAVCNATSKNGSIAMFGNCALMSFTSLASVSFGPTQNACQQRFFARSSLLTATSGQLLFPSRVGNISGTESVYGLTVSSDGQLFVTRNAKTSDQVSVYNITTLNFVRNITVDGATGYLYGLVVSADNNYLYIADNSNARLFKVNLSSSSTVANWTVANGPRGLSLNGLQNVLVASDLGRVQEFTSNGSVVRQINIGIKSYHAVEVNENILAVTFHVPHQASLISYNGTILNNYAPSGSTFYPMCLGVDKQGFVFVADNNNNQVLVLNPTLTVARPLRVTGNATVVVNRPLAMWLDPSIGHLYVGEFNPPYRVMIFDVSNVRTLLYTT